MIITLIRRWRDISVSERALAIMGLALIHTTTLVMVVGVVITIEPYYIRWPVVALYCFVALSYWVDV
jgi:hypothetical protein